MALDATGYREDVEQAGRRFAETATGRVMGDGSEAGAAGRDHSNGVVDMLAITPQMRILVAVEAVDFRKYAPSIDMRSRAVPTREIGLLRGFGRRELRFGPKHSEQHVGCRKRPRRKFGGTKDAMASSFSVGSALR